MAVLLYAVFSLVLLLNPGAESFAILPGDSLNHLEITSMAILNATLQACRFVAQTEGTDFTFPSEPYTFETVALACKSTQSSKSFRQAVYLITYRNVRVDIQHALNASFHFDDESFTGGRAIITELLQSVKASIKQENYDAARQKLGEMLHPLQDFYSHSNWVEIGNTAPNANLIRLDTSIGNIAAPTRATCRNCNGDDCKNNILEDIIEEKVLTSGYFGVVPIVSTKPPGKCSHGGSVDQTSKIEPKGGINKDTFGSSHGHLHTQAANLAIAATSQLLEDIRGAAGDKEFLQLMGISKGSSKALCFVIDITKSMSDDIEAVKVVTNTIINTEVGTDNEPSVYILVPFSDPDVGPLTKTTDPQVFKRVINDLSPSGGGDEPELSLSGLQLALTTAPFNSEIFLFTDAGAKDTYLKSTVIALIERTQTVVNFLITDSISTNRRRRSPIPRLAPMDSQLYKDLAQASGGLAIEVSKSDLSTASSIITEASISSVVTLLQTARSPGVTETFLFTVDETMTNVIVYTTGSSISYTLTSPSGLNQIGTSGSLVTSSESVGNFQTLRLTVQTGEWKLKLSSTNPYTLKVIGKSPIDILVDFVQASQGLFGGYDTLETRPKAGVEGYLVVTLTGSDSATVTEVVLVEAQGSNIIPGVVQAVEGTFLVRFATIPSGQFVVQVKGKDGPSVFQRQSPTSFTSSNLTITATPNDLLTPGTPFVVPFTISTSEVGVNITIRATNNRGFTSTYPSTLVIESGNSTNGTVTLSAPLNTPSGSDVTLTIEAETPKGDDNYVVLRFSVFNTVTDFTAPVCELLSISSNCSVNCSSYQWSFSAQVSDGADGTGVERVSLKEGNGTLTTSPDPQNANIIKVSYSASCCSPSMQLLVVDRVGNVDTCTFSYNSIVTSPSSLATKSTPTTFVLFITTFILLFFSVTK
ncbi:von Willebrand factor A domain-containing protein 7-like [Boleophthalmus pectinirostris]|uniref:von Willebrand factor A domain-containing protein 7-like n=1 Tax=Boleophthalmus pectinirostris TaxID=150288 RepID=UPI00242DE8FA|nr:von Willebrand factor A domain-containing protein 7-like [Boleophthalmus pectinirostris]XP_055004641.1 von Willebrand factor A domain-containing protein 7-like [Boleophthalmus pectinirostris]XP_055004642.1 von Willebrand factor A domain-containing protein 7-like [Boleophthalmus pectinirostris]